MEGHWEFEKLPHPYILHRLLVKILKLRDHLQNQKKRFGTALSCQASWECLFSRHIQREKKRVLRRKPRSRLATASDVVPDSFHPVYSSAWRKCRTYFENLAILGPLSSQWEARVVMNEADILPCFFPSPISFTWSPLRRFRRLFYEIAINFIPSSKFRLDHKLWFIAVRSPVLLVQEVQAEFQWNEIQSRVSLFTW